MKIKPIRAFAQGLPKNRLIEMEGVIWFRAGKKRAKNRGAPSMEVYLAMSMKTHDQKKRLLESLAMLLNTNNLHIFSGDIDDNKST